MRFISFASEKEWNGLCPFMYMYLFTFACDCMYVYVISLCIDRHRLFRQRKYIFRLNTIHNFWSTLTQFLWTRKFYLSIYSWIGFPQVSTLSWKSAFIYSGTWGIFLFRFYISNFFMQIFFVFIPIKVWVWVQNKKNVILTQPSTIIHF